MAGAQFVKKKPDVVSALRPAFFIQYLESCISRLNVIPCHDLTFSVSEPDNAAAQTGAGTSFGANGDQHTRAAELSTYFCVLTIRKQLSEMRFERSGGEQEPSRGHKFSILENSCPFGTASCWGVPAPNPAHIRTLRCERTACRAYITSPRSYRTDRRYNDQNECSTDS